MSTIEGKPSQVLNYPMPKSSAVSCFLCILEDYFKSMGLLRMGYKCIAKWRLIYNKPNKIEQLGNLEIMAKTWPKHHPSSFLGLLRPNMEFPVRFSEPCPYLASWTSSQSRIKVFKKKRCLHEDRSKYLNTWWTSEYIAGQFHDGFCKPP